MKKVILNKVKIDYEMESEELKRHLAAGASEFLDYRQTYMSLLKTPKDPQIGASFEETAQAMPIWKKFKDLPATDSVIILEDAEHKFLTECVTENAMYIQRSYELFEMGNSLKDAEDYELKEVKKG